MSLPNSSKISITNLIGLSTNGLTVANFAEIKTALINEYKSAYGYDIDIDDTTADGVFINNLSFMINNILQTVDNIYANLDIRSATGSQLDILCALSNIVRKKATKSNTNMLVTYLGDSQVTYTPSDLIFVDASTTEWRMTQSVTFNKGDTKSIYVECAKTGAITAPAGYINKVIDAALPLLIVQENDANIGQEAESDQSLRSRQTSSGSGVGTSVISGLESKLRSISGIRDVKIINNNTAQSVTVEDGAIVPAHTIYPIIRLQEGVTVDDLTIGQIIRNKLTPGISTVMSVGNSGTAKNFEYVETVNGLSTSTLDIQKVYWKQCEGIAPEISLTFTVNSYFSESTFTAIANYLFSYLSNLTIGKNVTKDELMSQALRADPKFKGLSTFIVTNATIAKDNSLSFYKYTSFNITVDTSNSSIYTMTLS